MTREHACITPTVSDTAQCHCPFFVVGIHWGVQTKPFRTISWTQPWWSWCFLQQSAHSTTWWPPQHSYDTTRCSKSPKVGPSCSIVDILTISNVQGDHFNVSRPTKTPILRCFTGIQVDDNRLSLGMSTPLGTIPRQVNPWSVNPLTLHVSPNSFGNIRKPLWPPFMRSLRHGFRTFRRDSFG